VRSCCRGHGPRLQDGGGSGICTTFSPPSQAPCNNERQGACRTWVVDCETAGERGQISMISTNVSGIREEKAAEYGPLSHRCSRMIPSPTGSWCRGHRGQADETSIAGSKGGAHMCYILRGFGIAAGSDLRNPLFSSAYLSEKRWLRRLEGSFRRHFCAAGCLRGTTPTVPETSTTPEAPCVCACNRRRMGFFSSGEASAVPRSGLALNHSSRLKCAPTPQCA
jgi:hypothetical protein